MEGESGEVDAGADDALVVVGVDADRVGLEVEGVLAVLDLLQLVLVQVRPPPDARVDHVREPLPTRNLNSKPWIEVVDLSVNHLSLQPMTFYDLPVGVHRGCAGW